MHLGLQLTIPGALILHLCPNETRFVYVTMDSLMCAMQLKFWLNQLYEFEKKSLEMHFVNYSLVHWSLMGCPNYTYVLYMYLFFVAVTGRPRSRMYNTQGRLSQRPVSFDERDYQSRYAKNLLYESEGNSIMDQLMWPEYLPCF